MSTASSSLGDVDVELVVQGEAVGPRQPDTRLSGLVEDDVDAIQHRSELGGPQVGLDQLEVGSSSRPAMFDRLIASS